MDLWDRWFFIQGETATGTPDIPNHPAVSPRGKTKEEAIANIKGCYTEGETGEEVLENIKVTVRLHVEDRLEADEEIRQV